MTRTTVRAAVRAGAVIAWLALAGCAPTVPLPPAANATSVPVPALRVAQVGHGGFATFALCRGRDCPVPTPKSRAKAAATGTQTRAASPTHVDAAPRLPNRASDTRSPHAQAGTDAQRPGGTVSVRFAFASARLDTAARAVLREALPRLSAARSITLVGHTDSLGPVAVNERLARARADAVLHALRTMAPGQPMHARIEAPPACCMTASNETPAARARNRRVDIHLGPEPQDAP